MTDEEDEHDKLYSRLASMKGSTDPAERLTCAIWYDVTGRRGWRQEADQFEPEICQHILDTWLDLIRPSALPEGK